MRLPLALAALGLGTAGLLAAPPARAQLFEGGARALGLGRATTALADDAWAEANPAAWATLPGRTAEAFAGQPFGMDELRTVALAVVSPTPLGAVAVVGRTYGFDAYRETRLSLGLGPSLRLGPTRRVAFGLRLDYYSISLGGDFGSTSDVGLSAGVQADVVPRLRAGLAARNLQALGRSDSTELTSPLTTAPAVSVGIAYRPTARTLLLLDAEKDLDYPLLVRAGVEARPVDALALRVGATTGVDGDAGAPTRLSFGLGFRAGPLRADLAVEDHEALGWSPAFSLGVQF